MIGDLLHAGAVVSSAFGVCCVAVQGRRPVARRTAVTRAQEFVVALGMLIAMVGVSVGAGSAVAWSAALVALALGSLPFGSRAAPAERRMIAYDALGAVIMAALMLVMDAGGSAAGRLAAGPVGAGHHGGAPLVLAVVLGSATLVYAGVAAFVVAVSRDLVGALRPLAMGGSVLLMGCGALAGF
jgi:hypothetical protein